MSGAKQGGGHRELLLPEVISIVAGKERSIALDNILTLRRRPVFGDQVQGGLRVRPTVRLSMQRCIPLGEEGLHMLATKFEKIRHMAHISHGFSAPEILKRPVRVLAGPDCQGRRNDAAYVVVE